MVQIAEPAADDPSHELQITREHDGRPRIDVTDLQTAGIESFVRSAVSTDRVALEHRGVRTYLVVNVDDSMRL